MRLTRLGLCATAAALAGASLAITAPSCTIFSGVVFVVDAGATGSGGAGGSIGTGGTDGGGLEVDHYLSMTDGAKLCSLLMTCPEPELVQSLIISASVPVDSSNYSLCMTWAAGRIPNDRIGIAIQRGVLACMAGAASCQEAGACCSEELYSNADPRCDNVDGGPDGGGLDYCKDPANVERCEGAGDSLHCANPYFSQSMCLVGDDGTVWCASGSNCTAVQSCVSGVLTYCGSPSNLRFSINCAAVGTECGIDPASKSDDCLTDGVIDTCTDSASICKGDTVKTCDFDRYSTFHCDHFGAKCDKTGGAPICRRPDDTCTPFDPDVNKCSGSKITLCVNGSKTDFDCQSIGKDCKTTPLAGCL